MFEPKFKVGEIVQFILTSQTAMILDILQHEPGHLFSTPYDGYLVRFNTLQEIPVREMELTPLAAELNNKDMD